ncbi:YihY/virulence factor BrkB family protein [Caryophanon tenue]|uniref:Ribonuclease n=1 Tax=Caryophanon tenue TaxID=33978 RepID=A0A1C0YI97_9BACL|nr:YihY/virulence factor BrkB family protein [Caryophanon tenue]OCS86912.1 ribonuclease [Caryophanon tenue]
MAQKKQGVVANVMTFVAPNEADIDITTWKGTLQDFILRIKNVDIGSLGAQLAYFFLLSFFPLLIFLVTLLPYLNLKQEDVYNFLDDFMPAEVYSLIEGILGDVLTNQSGGLLSIGILGTIWSASKGVDALMKALNKAYDVDPKSGIMNRVWSLIFTVAFVALILVALVLPIFGQQIGEFVFAFFNIESNLKPIWTTVRFILPFALIFIVMVLMYWIVPNMNPRIRVTSVLFGAAFSTIAWFVLTYGFSIYISNFGNYSATYGSIGGVIVLMLWLYFTGMILIIGGILNATMQRRKDTIEVRKNTKSPTFF